MYYFTVGNTDDAQQENGEPVTKKSKSEAVCFDCPNERCVHLFTTMQALDHHLLLGNCDYRLEKLSIQDKAKCLYGDKI